MITDTLTKPTLLLDEGQCRQNIQKMIQTALHHQVRLRPHFKTHQSRTVGHWMRQAGISCITVSSVTMASYFAADEWKDILIAFPFNVHELATVEAMFAQNENLQLGLTIEDAKVLDILANKIKLKVDIWIKVDAGYHRTGIPVEQTGRIQALLQVANQHDHMTAKGVLLHSGHTYNAHGKNEITQIHTSDALDAVAILRNALSDEFPNLEYSIGDTPSCSVAESFVGATELRPGNFCFYDVMQYYIGSNNMDEIAVCLACPVVAKHGERNEIVVYGGAIHFSKDSINVDGLKIFGLPVSIHESGWIGSPWKDSWVTKLSQEHGILRLPAERLDSIQIGDWIGILPIHSCLTADCMGSYLSLDGRKIDHMRSHSFD